jgi:hypothetical protein
LTLTPHPQAQQKHDGVEVESRQAATVTLYPSEIRTFIFDFTATN